MADSLYGVKRASKTKAKEISSSNSLAFSSSLASLIASTSGKPAAGRPRPSKKSDIFTAHNKNVKKRAAADMLDDGEQRHQTKDEIGSADSVELARSKRRLEEKARLYDAMKRGDHSGHSQGSDERGLVDFDRKWAERQAQGIRDGESDSSDDNERADDGELIEYTDEFGRQRKGTKSQVEREQRRQRIQANAAKEAEDFFARPSMPTNVIYGDAIQYDAFNPDHIITEKMAEIAKKRDRSATPPPDTHFDARAEVRTKGTGFYTFSQDSEERKRQMDALEADRLETEKIRKEREEKQQQRRREIEERKKLIAQQRSKAQADKFLNELEFDVG